MSEQAPGDRLAPLLLDPTRLRIAAALMTIGEVEFERVRDRVGLTDSTLSKQLDVLADAGLVGTRREQAGPAHTVWARLTPTGRLVLARHAQALRDITNASDAP